MPHPQNCETPDGLYLSEDGELTPLHTANGGNLSRLREYARTVGLEHVFVNRPSPRGGELHRLRNVGQRLYGVDSVVDVVVLKPQSRGYGTAADHVRLELLVDEAGIPNALLAELAACDLRVEDAIPTAGRCHVVVADANTSDE